MSRTWTVWETQHEDDESITVYNIGTPDGSWVADTGHLAGAETRKANAVLLAAAPDLLAALEHCLLAINELMTADTPMSRLAVPLEALRMGDAAIAKARGREEV